MFTYANVRSVIISGLLLNCLELVLSANKQDGIIQKMKKGKTEKELIQELEIILKRIDTLEKKREIILSETFNPDILYS